MPILDAAGSVFGGSSASASAAIRILGAGSFAGGAAFSGAAGVNFLSSALAAGGSSFEWDFVAEAGGVIAGASTASASAHIARAAGAAFFGGSLFLYGTLLPIYGASFFSVAPVVDAQLPPIKAITMGPKSFRWLQTLQRGDLSVFICDGRNAVSPVRIVFRLALLRLDGTRKYVGPQERSPVPGGVGEFYATGRAGESGQPGYWVIEWRYQHTAQSKVQLAEMEFRVLDAVAVGDPRDQLDRRVKFGWS